jgi:hypothetical protein
MRLSSEEKRRMLQHWRVALLPFLLLMAGLGIPSGIGIWEPLTRGPESGWLGTTCYAGEWKEKGAKLGQSTSQEPGKRIDQESPFGMHPAFVIYPGSFKNPYEEAQDIGVKWHRPIVGVHWVLAQPELDDPRFDFRIYDRDLGNVPPGIHIMANIAPELDLHERRSKRGSYLPIDEEKYKGFVKAAVERYDGDGKNAMPGLRNPILYWQVGNEPSITRKRDFAKLQVMTYTAIKEACPECKVLMGGTAHPILPVRQWEGDFETDIEKYMDWFSRDYEPILKELNGKYFDIFAFHWYGKAGGDYKGIKPVYQRIKSMLMKYNHPVPIWITEMGAYSGAPGRSGPLKALPFQTEREQAVDYFKRYVFSLSLGVQKIFALTLMEGFLLDDGYFDHTGLIYDGRGSNDFGRGVKKLSYYTYKKMTEVLEGSDWEKTERVQEGDGIYVYKFQKSGKPLWVAWNDHHEPKTVRITTNGNTKGLRILEVVPKYESGREVANYDAAFNEREGRRPESNLPGTEFVLGSVPVFIFER